MLFKELKSAITCLFYIMLVCSEIFTVRWYAKAQQEKHEIFPLSWEETMTQQSRHYHQTTYKYNSQYDKTMNGGLTHGLVNSG